MKEQSSSNRFSSKFEINPESGCWEWTACLSSNGYGKYAVPGSSRVDYAHRVSYEMHWGPIPSGLVIDHLCRNRACVNPDHLEAVTQRENLMRSDSLSAQCARKTHCVRGHPFDATNTYRTPAGKRYCRTCRREVNRAYSAMKRGETTTNSSSTTR